MKVLGEQKIGQVFVLSAPAGTGKTTLVQMLAQEFDCVVPSISFTTRAPRITEIDGRDYHFVSKDQFEKKRLAGDFLEYSEVFGHFYGTSKSMVESLQSKGKHVVLVIDTQGALKVKKIMNATFIFIVPPSLEVLKQRLIARKSESEESLTLRLKWAEEEMKALPFYDYQIVNDKLTTAYEVLRSILIAQEHKLQLRSSL